MKKLLLILITVFCLLPVFGVVTAFAEEPEEIPDNSEEVVESVEESAEETETSEITVTTEELKKIIDNALSEREKATAKQIATAIADKFNLNYETIYLIVAGLGVLVLLTIVFTVKYVRTKITLSATRQAYTNSNVKNEELSAILQGLSNEKISEIIEKQTKDLSKDIVITVTDEITDKLQLSDDVIGGLVGDNAVLKEQVEKIIQALTSLIRGERDVAIMKLETAPTVDTVKKLCVENEKLKTALGEEAVNKILE